MYWLCIACHLEKKICMCVHGCLSTKVYVCLFIRSRYTQRSVEIYRVASLDFSSPISVAHYLTAHNESSALLSGWWNHRCKGERASRWYEWALRSHVPTIQHEPVMKRQVGINKGSRRREAFKHQGHAFEKIQGWMAWPYIYDRCVWKQVPCHTHG